MRIPPLIIAIVTRGLVAVVLIVIAVGIANQLVASRPVPKSTAAARAPVAVTVIEAARVSVRRSWEGYGTARPVDSADVPARVTATVSTIPDGIREGARVLGPEGDRPGEILVELDSSDFLRQAEIARENIADLEAELQRLEFELEAAQSQETLAQETVDLLRAELEEYQRALAAGAAQQREVDAARRALLAAERDLVTVRERLSTFPARRASLQSRLRGQRAQVRLAEQNVERCTIRSPLTGILQTVDVEPGENLNAGQRVARVVSLRRVEVPLLLPASARYTLEPGDPALIRTTGADPVRWSAAVTRIAPENDPATRTLRVFVEVEQAVGDRRVLVPGTFVRGVVTASEVEPRWVVPRRALQDERVRVVREGRAVSVPVEIDFAIEARYPEFGIDDTQWVVLASALDRGVPIILDASRTLPIGAKIEPLPPGEAAEVLAGDAETDDS